MTTIIIQRHANPSITTYSVGFKLTESPRPLYLHFENGALGYNGIARHVESFQTLDDKAEALAKDIFAIDGVVAGHKLTGGNSVTIKQHDVRVVRDPTSTTDEEIEAQVVAILERTAGIPAGSAEVVVEAYQRTYAFAEAKRQADEKIEALGGLDYDSLAEDRFYY